MITLRQFIGLYTNIGDIDEITIVSISGICWENMETILLIIS